MMNERNGLLINDERGKWAINEWLTNEMGYQGMMNERNGLIRNDERTKWTINEWWTNEMG